MFVPKAKVQSSNKESCKHNLPNEVVRTTRCQKAILYKRVHIMCFIINLTLPICPESHIRYQQLHKTENKQNQKSNEESFIAYSENKI